MNNKSNSKGENRWTWPIEHRKEESGNKYEIETPLRTQPYKPLYWQLFAATVICTEIVVKAREFSKTIMANNIIKIVSNQLQTFDFNILHKKILH